MHWLTGDWSTLGTVAGKAALMYVLALAGLRVSPRRTLAQWTAIDFAAAIAIGAIIGRTAIANDQSFVIGAVALVTLLFTHWLVSLARFSPVLAKLVDHRVRVLVDHGRIHRDQLRRCGVTENDLLAKLREQGVASLDDLRYVLYENKGDLTIVTESSSNQSDADLVAIALSGALGTERR